MDMQNSNSPISISQLPDGETWGAWTWDAFHQTLEITTHNGSKYDFSPFRPHRSVKQVIMDFEEKRWLSAINLLDLETALIDLRLQYD
jgi:YD repeat-containing protein